MLSFRSIAWSLKEMTSRSIQKCSGARGAPHLEMHYTDEAFGFERSIWRWFKANLKKFSGEKCSRVNSIRILGTQSWKTMSPKYTAQIAISGKQNNLLSKTCPCQSSKKAASLN